MWSLQLRRDSAADWTSVNPTLLAGELGFETDAKKIKIGDGSTAWTSLEYVIVNSRSRTSTQFDKTNNDTLANVTGLTATVIGGKTYSFRAVLHVTADATGGHKYAIAGTATATAIIYQINSIRNSTNAFVINSRQVALVGSAGEAGATAAFTTIEGVITVNAGGTLTVQFAQNVATPATTSSVLIGSTFELAEII